MLDVRIQLRAEETRESNKPPTLPLCHFDVLSQTIQVYSLRRMPRRPCHYSSFLLDFQPLPIRRQSPIVSFPAFRTGYI